MEKHIKSHSETEIVNGCIALMQELVGEFEDYLDFMNIIPESEEERFAVNFSYFHIVQRLMLWKTMHSGGTSTTEKCRALGFDPSDIVSFKDERDKEDMSAQTFNQITKARPEQLHKLTVMKSDDERRLVFGWANVAVRVDGEQIVDWQEDIIDIEELEKAAYEYVAEFGTAGEMHQRGGVGHVIESVVFTKEKAEALGIPPDILPEGWWIGFQITDDEVWDKVKSGEYPMFSIEGKAVREPVEGGDN